MLFANVPALIAKNFRFCRADADPRLLKEVYHLRYVVYCTERGFECPEAYPDGLEIDEYDAFSDHFCVIALGSGRIIGTVRLILDSFLGFPIERHCLLDEEKKIARSATKIGEISRLAVSKNLRRNEIHHVLPGLKQIDFMSFKQVQEVKRSLEEAIVLGLYQCLYHHSLALGLTHWYAVMAEGLCDLLRRKGVAWTQVGRAVEYHGYRIPYRAEIEENKRKISLSNPRLLERPPGWA